MQPAAPPSDLSPARARGDRAAASGWPLRLCVGPFVVALLIVCGWWCASRLLRADWEAAALVGALRARDRDSWQKAYALVELLHDPTQDALKDDRELCAALAGLLAWQLAAAPDDAADVGLQVFLCRAVGQLRVPDGLPVLLDAASGQARAPAGAVRCAVLEAIAVLTDRVGSERVREDPRTIPVLLAASHIPADAQTHGDLHQRAVRATFALGVVGGAQAIERLTELLDHPHPDLRFNAAAGLARHGQCRAMPVILEMLDLAGKDAPCGQDTDPARRHKQTLVVSNAVRAAAQLADHYRSLDARPLIDALRRAQYARWLPQRTRAAAQDLLRRLASP